MHPNNIFCIDRTLNLESQIWIEKQFQNISKLAQTFLDPAAY